MRKEDLQQAMLLKRKIAEQYLVSYKIGIITIEELLLVLDISTK